MAGIAFCGANAVSGSGCHAAPPAAAAEATLRPKVELTIGLNYVPGGQSAILRQGTDYAEQIVAVRRTLTGGIVDTPRYASLGYLYRQANLLSQSHAAFQRGEIVCQDVLRRSPRDGFALAQYGRFLAASGQKCRAIAFLRHAVTLAPSSADVQLALGFLLSQQVLLKAAPTAPFARDAAAA